MRTHRDIIKAVTPQVVADLTGRPITTVRSWAQRDSIPADHWLALVDAHHCTADELMAAAAKSEPTA